MFRLLTAVLLLTATGALAGDREVVRAAIDATCGNYVLGSKARRVCEECFVRFWPEASRCANRCDKGDADCIAVCKFDFDAEIGACTLNAVK